MNHIPRDLPTFETGLKSHYAAVRTRLGVKATQPFFFRPPPIPVSAPVKSPRSPHAGLTIEQRIQLAAKLATAKIAANHNVRRATHFPAAIAEVFDVPLESVLSNSRLVRFVVPRQIGITMALLMLNKSLPAIGRVFGRDHSTVKHARDKWIGVVRAALAAEQANVNQENV